MSRPHRDHRTHPPQQLPTQSNKVGYPAFFELFNRGLFYEAHDALETVWLPARGGPDAPFYQGLIQIAGAFVHVQKGRINPAKALLRRARSHLQPFPAFHHGLALPAALALIDRWLERLDQPAPPDGHLNESSQPQLRRDWSRVD